MLSCPWVLLRAFLGDLGSRAMVLGLLLGVLGSKLGGTRRMLYLAPAVGIVAGLGAITAYYWSWVVLLAVVGIIAGAGMRFGWLPSLLMLTFAATFPVATSSAKHAAAYGAIAAIGHALRHRAGASFQGSRGGRGPARLPPGCRRRGVFGIVLGGAAAIGVALGWTEPYWGSRARFSCSPSTSSSAERERMRQKALGTALGVIAVVPVAIAAPPALGDPPLLAAEALLLAIAVHSKRYWLYYALFTFASRPRPARPAGPCWRRGRASRL